MISKSIGLLAIIVVLVAAVRMARAQEEIHEGKVVAVSTETIMVLDERDDDTDQFLVTAETKITYNGKSASLREIKPGDRAKVTAVLKGDKLVAKQITARSAE